MRLSKEKRAWYRGVLAALALVKDSDYEVLYREIVGTMDEKELIAVALDDEYATAEWAGLVRYGYVAKREE
jgi:hypothetical protein